jgi:integrase
VSDSAAENPKIAEVFRRRVASMSELLLSDSPKTAAKPKKERVPSYRRHRQSSQAIVTLPDGMGGRRDVLLGKFGTKASLEDYGRVLGEWKANGRRLPAVRTTAAPVLSVAEVTLAYWQHVETYYRMADGSPTTEVNNIRLALRPLKALYASKPAASFDALALETVRQRMIEEGHCRNRINKDVARIKRLFKWAGSKKLVPSSVYHDLKTVEGLREGRSEAKETSKVLPVPRGVVEQTLTVMRPTLADMVRLQLETGMRPGELCIMRGIDIDMTGVVWLYHPSRHKTEHHGYTRVVPLGPRAQDIVRRHLKTDVQAYLFTPADSVAEFRADQRQSRKSKVQPSQNSRAKRKPKRRPGQRYTKSSYANAVADACNRAFPPPEHLLPQIKPNGKRESRREWTARLTDSETAKLKAWRKDHRWHPHQLRHTRAQELKRQAGLDVARAVLGHKSPVITEHYATLDIAAAAEIMAKIG